MGRSRRRKRRFAALVPSRDQIGRRNHPAQRCRAIAGRWGQKIKLVRDEFESNTMGGQSRDPLATPVRAWSSRADFRSNVAGHVRQILD